MLGRNPRDFLLQQNSGAEAPKKRTAEPRLPRAVPGGSRSLAAVLNTLLGYPKVGPPEEPWRVGEFARTVNHKS